MVDNMIPELQFDIILSTISLVVWYHSIELTLPVVVNEDKLKKQKRLSWIFSLLSAFIAVGVCIVKLDDILDHKFSWSSTDLVDYVYGTDRVSQFAIRFFCVYLFIDSIYMYLFYYDVSNWISWAHHIGYLIFMTYTLYVECPMIFVAYFPIEFSSIFLASGSIWKSCRQDLVFGISFFCVRVLYHGILVMFCLRNISIIPYPSTVLGAVISWLMHIKWFFGWWKSYMKKQALSKKITINKIS